MTGSATPKLVSVIVIGRNEGPRLVRCLESLARAETPPAHVVYVDSGSSDGSVMAARSAGAQVVDLDLAFPFTAARARNAGLEALATKGGAIPEFVQFVDGDCEMHSQWLSAASLFLIQNPDVAVVSGRLRERHPEASVYNRLCDAEWDTPIGQVRACGGIAMMRRAALAQSGPFNPSLIAGEEPELCLRLRRAGWTIWRIQDEMALHDAAMMRFGQFWKRARRGGFAYAEGAAMYGRDAERHGIAGRRQALFWGLALPMAILLAALVLGPWTLFGLLIYPAQILRLALRDDCSRVAWERAWFLTLGKFAEAQGFLEYHWRKSRSRPVRLIEYK